MNKIKTYKDINNGLYISTHHPPLLGEDVLTTVDVEVIGSPNYKGVKCNGIKVSANGKHDVIARGQARSDTVQGTTLNEEAVDFLEPFAKWAAADAYCESKKKIKVEPKETIKAKDDFKTKPSFNKFKFKKKFYGKKGFKGGTKHRFVANRKDNVFRLGTTGG